MHLFSQSSFRRDPWSTLIKSKIDRLVFFIHEYLSLFTIIVNKATCRRCSLFLLFANATAQRSTSTSTSFAHLFTLCLHLQSIPFLYPLFISLTRFSSSSGKGKSMR